jgi:hypothetical protein
MIMYDVMDWYWLIGGNVYSSKLRNYVPSSEPAYVAWTAGGLQPFVADDEYGVGGVLALHTSLRPIPQGILDGYLDTRLAAIVASPDFGLWVDTYTELLHPTPTESQIRARIRSKL